MINISSIAEEQVCPFDFIDGHAYMQADNSSDKVFIANKTGDSSLDTLAFSICGKGIIRNCESHWSLLFVEVDLNIQVTRK